MRTRNPILLTGFIFFLLSSSLAHAGTGHRAKSRKHLSLSHSVVTFTAAFEQEATMLYDEIELENQGLSKKAFEYAYKGYQYLLKHRLLNHCNILTICDFSQSSRNKRLYIIDMDEKKVLINTYVAHGRGSGGEFAHTFSNSRRSHKSSLGFYVTENTYYGDHGLALKIRGLEKGFNDRAYGRSIVVHGSHYVGEDFLQSNPFNGRSFGCPAVPSEETADIIDAMKEGACLFIYHPTKKYLTKSKILNS